MATIAINLRGPGPPSKTVFRMFNRVVIMVYSRIRFYPPEETYGPRSLSAAGPRTARINIPRCRTLKFRTGGVAWALRVRPAYQPACGHREPRRHPKSL